MGKQNDVNMWNPCQESETELRKQSFMALSLKKSFDSSVSPVSGWIHNYSLKLQRSQTPVFPREEFGATKSRSSQDRLGGMHVYTMYLACEVLGLIPSTKIKKPTINKYWLRYKK